jgi:hypothetical protein
MGCMDATGLGAIEPMFGSLVTVCPKNGHRLAEAALPHDLSASVRIAEWACERTEQASSQVWGAKDVFRYLGPECPRLLLA